ncbi:hypothetical protein SynPROS91_02348 [Synechococcus sp. PROS-9-1]|nr:hypothetical protein SynPROS91_02348 [Synechococcus sp. PROS-9-1]
MQAIRCGVDVFMLQVTLGHSSSATTGHYVAANPRESSSLSLAYCTELLTALDSNALLGLLFQLSDCAQRSWFVVEVAVLQKA